MKAAFWSRRAPDQGVYASLAKNLAAEAAIFCHRGSTSGGYGFMSEYETNSSDRSLTSTRVRRPEHDHWAELV